MVVCVLDKGWTIEANAERFQVDAKTVRKWRLRFLAEGGAGLQDRSPPRRSPNRTLRSCRRRVIQLRTKHRWGADHIAHHTGLAASTVQSILRRAGLARPDRGDRATNTARPHRYQRDQPGELIHVDIKKIAGIRRRLADPRQRQRRPPRAWMRRLPLHPHRLDDPARIAYSERHPGEQAITAAGFWLRAAAFFASLGIHCDRVITDNGSCYRSGRWHQACASTVTTVKKTKPRRPQNNDKVERFHRILLEEWAYIRPWTSDAERTAAYTDFIHFYNHRPHGALGWHTPIATLTQLHQDNLPAEHN